jgi:hypothetical protein
VVNLSVIHHRQNPSDSTYPKICIVGNSTLLFTTVPFKRPVLKMVHHKSIRMERNIK